MLVLHPAPITELVPAQQNGEVRAALSSEPRESALATCIATTVTVNTTEVAKQYWS